MHSVGYGGVFQSPLVTSIEKICLWNLSLVQTNITVHTTYPSFLWADKGVFSFIQGLHPLLCL